MGSFKLFAALAAVALVFNASPAKAQVEMPWVIEGYGGIVIPTGDYGDAVKTGFGFGGAVGYRLTPAFSLWGNFNYGIMKGATVETVELPDQDLLAYFAMAGYNFTPELPDWDVLAFLGAGGMTFSPDEGDSETNFAVNGGFKAYYWISPTVALSGAANVGVAFTDEETFGSSTTVVLPAYLGVAFRF